MRTSLRYYSTEKRYHATAEFSSGLAIDSRFPSLELTAQELMKKIVEFDEEIPMRTQNGPTGHDIQQLKYLNEYTRPLSQEEEEKFLDLLGL
ncbi:hypothetical protein JXB28_06280 [Candidatus Woesearchaeota archaeon]|nr:hypothetical protein [Candidatus Woesearchaeota archaeon]